MSQLKWMLAAAMGQLRYPFLYQLDTALMPGIDPPTECMRTIYPREQVVQGMLAPQFQLGHVTMILLTGCCRAKQRIIGTASVITTCPATGQNQPMNIKYADITSYGCIIHDGR